MDNIISVLKKFVKKDQVTADELCDARNVIPCIFSKPCDQNFRTTIKNIFHLEQATIKL